MNVRVNAMNAQQRKKIIYIREQEFMTSQTQFYAGLFI